MGRPTPVGKVSHSQLAGILALVSILGCVSSNSEPRLNTQEALLKQRLFELREKIDNYTEDKKKAPQSLKDLIAAGYLKEIPIDPVTGSDKTWITVKEPTVGNNGRIETGITDVHSGSNAVGSDGTPYASW
jgi:general secretion pathway protein G